MYDFGERLRQARINKRLNIKQVSERLGMHRSSVSGYENNTRTPTVEILTKFALLYNVTTDYLLGIDNKKFLCVDRLTDRQVEALRIFIDEMIEKDGK